MLTSGKITLRDRRDVFDTEATAGLMMIWDELRSNSVEVAVAFPTYFTLEQFASDYCIYFAGIFVDTSEATSRRAWPEEIVKPRPLGLEREFRPKSFLSENDPPPLSDVLLIGAIYLISSHFEKEVTLGIALLPHAQGKGYAYQAVDCLLGWAFNECGYHRVQVAIMDGPHKSAAMRLFAKTGFVHEGRRSRQVLHHVNLEYRDVTYMGIVDTDWIIRRYRRDIPYSAWDELFQRHAREREALLEMERAHCQLKRSASTETLRQTSLKVKEELKPPVKNKRQKTIMDGNQSTAAKATACKSKSEASDSTASLFSDWIQPFPTELEDEGDVSSSSLSPSSSYDIVSAVGSLERGLSPPVSESAIGSASSRSNGNSESDISETFYLSEAEQP